MRCVDVERYVYLYLDGELDERDCAELEAHLQACAACRHTVQQEQRFVEGLRRGLVCAPAPHALRRRIREAIAQGGCLPGPSAGWGAGVHRRHAGRWLMVAAAGALAVVALIATAAYRQPVLSRPGARVGSASAVSTDPLRIGGMATLAGAMWSGAGDVLSELVSLLPGSPDELVDKAISTHQADAPLDTPDDRDTVARCVRRWAGIDFHPPLPETHELHLVGVRVGTFRSVPIVVYGYDFRGRRLTLIQVPVPASLPVRPGIPLLVTRRHGYNVLAFSQGGNLLTSLVTDLPEYQARRLLAIARMP